MGYHRWQRIPSTEKNGRMHTSTVLVTLVKNEDFSFTLKKSDVVATFTKGTGNGGQNKNKVETCVVLRHIPTNITIRIDGRSRIQNEELAWKGLEMRVSEYYKSLKNKENSDSKRNQVGIQNRANKVRTYNVKNDFVKDHVTNKTITIKQLYKGDIDKLHK